MCIIRCCTLVSESWWDLLPAANVVTSIVCVVWKLPSLAAGDPTCTIQSTHYDASKCVRTLIEATHAKHRARDVMVGSVMSVVI